jgi:hypothetical protein
LPKNIPSPTKGPRAGGATHHGVIDQLDQPLLDVVLLCVRDQAIDVETGRLQACTEDLDVVHRLRLFPHMMAGGAEIWAATAPRISINVLAGKNGFCRNFVMLWRRMKRCISIA